MVSRFLKGPSENYNNLLPFIKMFLPDFHNFQNRVLRIVILPKTTKQMQNIWRDRIVDFFAEVSIEKFQNVGWGTDGSDFHIFWKKETNLISIAVPHVLFDLSIGKNYSGKFLRFHPCTRDYHRLIIVTVKYQWIPRMLLIL